MKLSFRRTCTTRSNPKTAPPPSDKQIPSSDKPNPAAPCSKSITHDNHRPPTPPTTSPPTSTFSTLVHPTHTSRGSTTPRIPGRPATLNITHLSSPLLLQILKHALTHLSSVVTFRRVCRKLNRAFTANPVLADEVVWKRVAACLVDVGEDMETVRSAGQTWEAVVK
ncbi:hypothetical protein HDU98_003189, partial [Podochytrium sp. JEL0797]